MAVGEGRYDAMVGMLFGASIYALSYDKLKEIGIFSIGNFEKIRVPNLFEINQWVIIFGISSIIFLVIWFIEKNNYKTIIWLLFDIIYFNKKNKRDRKWTL